MRRLREEERLDLLRIQRDPEADFVYPDEFYTRPDGRLLLYRDGLAEMVHRRFYRLLIDSNLGRQKLVQTCTERLCVNPHHFRMIAGTLERGAKTHCRNGHAYDEVGLTPSGHCPVCAAARKSARSASGRPDGSDLNRAKQRCPRNHLLSGANLYVYTDPRGYRHRRCRTCNRDRDLNAGIVTH